MAVWALKCTRVFGSGVGTTCMIPMADAFNHCQYDSAVETINITQHLEGRKNTEYYRISKYLANVTPIFEKHGFSKEVLSSDEVKGRFNSKMYKGNLETLSTKVVAENLKQKEIWSVPFYYDEWTEDNETDSSDEEESSKPKWVKRYRSNGHGLEYYIHEESELLKRVREKRAKK